jgi:hypothetical protein
MSDPARNDATDADADAVDEAVRRDAPGGPYFGRLLVVLLAAVAFCALMTWWLSTTMTN